MKNLKKLFLPLLIAVFLSAIICATIFVGCKPEPKTIKIGAILPLTGGASEFGVGNKNGIILMVEDINAKGGINGKKISVFFEDSQNDPKIAISIFNKMLKTDKPEVFFICMSSVAMALKPLIEQNKIPAFCVSATPDLTKDSKFMFRLLPTVNQYAKSLATLIGKDLTEDKNIGLFYIQDEFGETFRSSFLEQAKNSSLNVVFESSFDKEGKDFRSIITKMLNYKPAGIVMGGYGNSLGILIKQLREFGYKGKIYGTPDMGYPRVTDLVGNKLGEAYIVDFNIDYSNERVKNFVSKYMEKFGEAPSPDAFIGYDGLGLIAESYANYSRNKLSDLREGIMQIKEYPGIMGILKINENGDVEFSLKLKKIK